MTHPARKIDPILIYEQMQQQMKLGLVRETAKDNLRLYCYTQKCSYERGWNESNILARGLIIDIARLQVVATPFPKFFNLNERPEDKLPNSPFEVFEKLDGSLIILFHHEGKWKTATKGSLNSEQAQWAANWLQDRNLKPLIKGVTYLCEVIYPENKIVIPYSKQGLTMLGAYYDDGLEMSYDTLAMTAQMLDWDIAQRFEYDSLAELVTTAAILPKYEEGFVIRYSNGHRIKIKGAEYCRIHRLISNVTPLAIWDMLRNGDNIEEIRKELPEEFLIDFDNIKARLEQQYKKLKEEVEAVVEFLEDVTDKEVGLRLNTFPEHLRGFIFAARKGGLEDKKFVERVFRSIRPISNYLEGYVPSTNIIRVQEND